MYQQRKANIGEVHAANAYGGQCNPSHSSNSSNTVVRSAALDWMGPRAFKARYGVQPGLDRDFGMWWGPRHDQRVSHRRDRLDSRNPTRTPTFDKSRALYRPTHQGLDRDANVVVVEGAIDALAIAATAARGGELSMFAPATTSGVTVSGVQARAVLALHATSPVIALDGDRAGREGTDRWLRALCIERGRPAW